MVQCEYSKHYLCRCNTSPRPGERKCPNQRSQNALEETNAGVTAQGARIQLSETSLGIFYVFYRTRGPELFDRVLTKLIRDGLVNDYDIARLYTKDTLGICGCHIHPNAVPPDRDPSVTKLDLDVPFLQIKDVAASASLPQRKHVVDRAVARQGGMAAKLKNEAIAYEAMYVRKGDDLDAARREIKRLTSMLSALEFRLDEVLSDEAVAKQMYEEAMCYIKQLEATIEAMASITDCTPEGN